MKGVDMGEIWEGIAMLAVIAAAAMATLVIVKDKKVDGYYLSQGGSGEKVASCVYAHWTWHNDEVAFCSDDYNKALDFAARANATLR